MTISLAKFTKSLILIRRLSQIELIRLTLFLRRLSIGVYMRIMIYKNGKLIVILSVSKC